MEVVLVAAVLILALGLIAGPLRRPPSTADARESPAHAELRSAKEAKYREIREAELDLRTGKLSDEDWRSLDSALRTEAVRLMRRLEALERRDGVDAGEPT
jgi:hypothetical protein